MKKLFTVLFTAVFAAALSAAVYAADPKVFVTDEADGTGEFEIVAADGVKRVSSPAVLIYIDGDYIYNADAVIKNGTTLVPLRVISEYFHADVQWEAETKTVKLWVPRTSIECPVGADHIIVDGIKKELTAPSQIIDSATYVPLRAISEAYDTNVDYFGDIAEDVRIITIESKWNEENVSAASALEKADSLYFDTFMPSMRDYFLENFKIELDGITKDNIFENLGKRYIGDVKDVGHYWYVRFFENEPSAVLVDKETGDMYAVHAFSAVRFAVSDIGDLGGWGWYYQ